MKFVHTADWHIGAGREYIPNSLDRVMHAIDGVYEVAQKNQANIVVVAGDIFDSPNILPEERKALSRKILAYDEAGIGTLMIPGNHDQMTDHTSTLDYLEVLSHAGHLQNSVITQTTKLVVRDGYGFLLFVNEPWSRLGRHIRDIVHGSVTNALKGLIVVAHQTIKGSKTVTGIDMRSGILFQPDDVVDYYAFGDIHLRQSMSPGAWYPGPPLQVNFGENAETGVLLVDSSDFQRPTFHPIKTTRLVTVKDSAEAARADKDAIVRLMYDEKPLLAEALPENVVKLAWQAVDIDLSGIRSQEGLLGGLDEVLARRGLTEAEVEEAMEEMKKVVAVVGDST